MTRCTKHVLSKGCMHANQLLPWLLEGEACHISGRGCINTYLRNPICSTHFLACKTSSHQWLGEYVGKLIFGAYTLNANVPFLLVISYEMVADINVLRIAFIAGGTRSGCSQTLGASRPKSRLGPTSSNLTPYRCGDLIKHQHTFWRNKSTKMADGNPLADQLPKEIR